MYRPQQAQWRYMLVHLCREYRDELEIISTTWKPYHNEKGELVSILPTADIIFK